MSKTVTKLFPDGWPIAAANREVNAARFAHACGLPTPVVIDRFEQDNRHGIVFEKCPGASLLDGLVNDPSPDRIKLTGITMAELHAEIHRCETNELPPMTERWQVAIRRTTAVQAAHERKVLRLLSQLPQGHCLCHGDFHPAQIIGTANRYQIVDWFDAGGADPLADVAKTLLLLAFGSLPTAHATVIDPIRKLLADYYLGHYQTLNPISIELLPQWTAVAAAARLSQRLPTSEVRVLLDLIEVGLRAAHIS